MELSFTVLGHAQPAGSKRAFAIKKAGKATGQVAVMDANPKAKSWQQEVKTAALEAMEMASPAWDPNDLYTVPPLFGPLSFSMTFYVQRPKGHYGTGKNAQKLKDSAPALPTTKPDVTKLVRGVEDALTGIVWLDDAQVTDQSACKRYGLPERVEIVVRYAPSVGHRT